MQNRFTEMLIHFTFRSGDDIRRATRSASSLEKKNEPLLSVIRFTTANHTEQD